MTLDHVDWNEMESPTSCGPRSGMGIGGPVRLVSSLLGLMAVMGDWGGSPCSPLYGQDSAQSRFTVPGYDMDMQALDALQALHLPRAFSNCTLWDRWLPQASLWATPTAAQRYRQSLLQRRIDREGYVAMQQHRGMAHSDGWPFPGWQQSTGVGFHFSIEHETWAIQSFALTPLADHADWQVEGGRVLGIDPSQGLKLDIDDDLFQVTTPEFRCGTIVAPFVRLEWAGLDLSDQTEIQLQWRLEDQTDWSPDRSWTIPRDQLQTEMRYLNVPLYRAAGYAGLVCQYRLVLHGAAGGQLQLKSLITAIDTRHPITNANYLRGCCDYIRWTGDRDFVQQNIGRMRQALHFALEEFSVREGRHVHVRWVGHDGRSGIVIDDAGVKTLRPGLGVGNNYWDLLPFGGQDALATLYLYDAIKHMVELEQTIAARPQWEIPPPEHQQSATELRSLAEAMGQDFRKRFWNPATQRFVGWIDADGQAHDYGFTFVNLEAITYGIASQEQARQILAWLDDQRVVRGDTSQGDDIYHWRFAPRATTRRNVETYVWAWSAPESIPWGGQVQDGGAVLGFSYHDLMARLETHGPDDAWRRLQEILTWFREVQDQGGYRAYYSQPGRGTLQGGGTAGGLGLDQEFMESILLPQIMVDGFLGFRPTPDGYRIQPRLPSQWPSLTVDRVHWRDQILRITAHADGSVEVEVLQDGTQHQPGGSGVGG